MINVYEENINEVYSELEGVYNGFMLSMSDRDRERDKKEEMGDGN